MARAKQISAWVEDRPGMLGQVAAALGEKGVSIRAFMAAVMDGRGFVRVVVDKPAAAKRIFAAHGWRTTEDEVLEVTVPDRPGALGDAADRLGAAGVNIEYAYVGNAGSARKVNLYLAVRDLEAALRALR
ncbi:MAG TPA: ACT domain-containing protein [Anaeromyxobacter sp.]|nr:ACT domain-containing protein [Anaeromyxobacter sp.]